MLRDRGVSAKVQVYIAGEHRTAGEALRLLAAGKRELHLVAGRHLGG
jgi:hypothetical protein